jgi:protein TonB
MAHALLRSRQRTRPSRGALVGSLTLHLLLGGTVFASTRLRPAEPPMNQFKTYRVELVSPPPQVEGEPKPVEPAPKPAIVKQPKPPEPKPKPVVKKPTPKVAETKPGTAKEPKEPVRGRNARPGPVGGENLNVLQEGEDCPDPAYCENVIRQINRYFRWTGAGNLEAEIGFYIHRNGSVSGLRVFKRSGDYKFDLAAADAVTYAGKSGGFGPLAGGFSRDSLGVLFRFVPPNR